jgi:N-acetylglucosaminyldiphosphoundecaprenol N-acetyl-beta-D-mannosaminyltransferase
MTVKRNWSIARETRIEKHNFENAQLRMRESSSLSAWWEAVCVMAKRMHFQNIGLWKRCDGHYVSTCVWNMPESKYSTGKTMKLVLPLHGNGTAEWEIRANIWVDGYLELSGRQAMLLGRLMDEFPPPEQEKEVEALDQRSNTTHRSMIEEKTALLTNTQTLRMPAHIPVPLSIMGIPVTPFESYAQALECIERIIESDQKTWWVAINPVKIYNAWHNPELLDLLRQIDVGICDGVGVSIASMILHGRSINRCTGCDLFFRLLFLASRRKWGVYLLGASAQSNAAARSELQKMYPELRIVGWHDGYFKDSHTVIEQINSSGADLLFVAMGSPKQEHWIWRHRQAIDANFCMGVGGSFDIASGRLRRAPRVFRMTGTEFLFRLVREPLKRWPIQKVLFPYFLRVVGQKMVDFTMSDENRRD